MLVTKKRSELLQWQSALSLS